MTLEESHSRGEKRKRNEKEGSELLGLASTVSRLNQTDDAAAAGTNNDQQDSSAADNDGWTTVNHKNKRQKKERENYPAIVHSSSARLQSFIKISDLQNLVLYLLADGTGPQWVSVRHKKDVERVVCLLVPGLETDMFNGNISLDADEDREEQEEQQQQQHREQQQRDGQTGAATATTSHLDGTTNIAPSHKPPRKLKLNITPDDYYPTKLVPEKLPAPLAPLADIFPHIWPIKTPGEYYRMHSPLYAILNAPIPKQKDDRKTKGPKPPNVGKDFQSKRTPVTEFLATKEELSENGFAVHPAHLHTDEDKAFEAARRYKSCRSAEDGWLDLPENMTSLTPGTVPFEDVQAGSMTAGRNVLFIDCEMVTTTVDKFALARVSFLTWDGETVLDELVQPPDPVIDYLTPYSGISKSLLDPVTTTLQDIQAKLKTLLTPTTILAGHSLDSDLKALKISFPFIVDTTLLYPHPKGAPQKSSLKWLSQKYLSREIQNRGPQGHDSIEDARACLDLVKQKCEKGRTWGTSEATGESIFKRLSRSNDTADSHGRTGAVVDWGDPSKGYGSSATVAIRCENDDDVVAGVKRVVCGASGPGFTDDEVRKAVLEEIPRAGVDFTWGRLRELEALRGWWNTSKSAEQSERLAKTLHQTDGELSTEALAAATAKTVRNIREIWEALPPKTAFIVYTGSGDPKELRRLSEMQSQFKKAYQTLKWDELPVQWTDVEEQAIKQAALKARAGAGFVAVK